MAAVNKVDMKNALPGIVTQQITTTFGIPSQDVMQVHHFVFFPHVPDGDFAILRSLF